MIRFEVDEDGKHVWWFHTCSFVGYQDGLEPDGTVAAMLPLAPQWWTVLSYDPLTVKPSIECGECHVHGHITDGKWQPC